MKRIYVAISLILAVCALSVTGYIMTKKSIVPMLDTLEEIMYETQDDDMAALGEKVDILLEKWQESEKILTILLRHSKSIDIDERMKALGNCAKSNDAEELLNQCASMHAALSALLESEYPSIRNVL